MLVRHGFQLAIIDDLIHWLEAQTVGKMIALAKLMIHFFPGLLVTQCRWCAIQSAWF